MKALFIIGLILLSGIVNAQNYLGYTKYQLDFFLDADSTVYRIKETTQINGDVVVNVKFKENKEVLYSYVLSNDTCYMMVIASGDYSMLDYFIGELNRIATKKTENIWMSYKKRTTIWKLNKQELMFTIVATYQ